MVNGLKTGLPNLRGNTVPIRRLLKRLRSDRQHECVYKASGWLVFHGPAGWELYDLSANSSLPARFCPGCGINLRKVTK